MITVQVNDKVSARYKRMPEEVRSRLRAVIPFLTLRLKQRVAAKLAPGILFETTTNLLPALSSQMVENSREIYGRVFIDSSRFPEVVARTLESGAKAHVIAAKNAGALSFFWPKVGRRVAFKSVHHPGFPGRSYLRSSLDEMTPEITRVLTAAAVEAVSGRRP